MSSEIPDYLQRGFERFDTQQQIPDYLKQAFSRAETEEVEPISPKTRPVALPGLAAKGAVSGLGWLGDIANLSNLLGRKAAEKAAGLFLHEQPNVPEPFHLPGQKDISSLLEKLFPSLVAQSPTERGFERGGQILTNVLTGGEAPLAKESIMSALGAGIGGGYAESQNLGPIAEFLLSLGGGTAPSVGSAISRAFTKKTPDLISMVAAENAPLQQMAQAAEAEKITLPRAALKEGSFIENRLQSFPFARGVYDQFFNKFYKDYRNAWNRNLDKVSTTKYENRLEAGATVKEYLEKNRQIAEDENRLLYDKAEKRVADQKLMMPQKNLKQNAEKLVVQLEKSLSQASEEKGTKATLQEIIDNLKNITNEKGDIPVDVGIATKRSLNKKINWEQVGGPQKLLRSVNHDLNVDIKKALRQDKLASKLYEAAETHHGDMSEIYRNDLINSVINGEVPELVLNKMNTLSNIKKLERSLSTTPEGKEAFDALKRYRLRQVLENKIFSKEGIKHGTAASALEDKETAALIKELAGPQAYQGLKNLQKVSQGIESGFSKFGNPSKTADVGTAAGHAIFVATQFAHALSNFSIAEMILAGGEAMAPYLIAKILTNPRLLNNLQKAAAAGLKNNSANWKKYMVPAIEEIARYVEENEE